MASQNALDENDGQPTRRGSNDRRDGVPAIRFGRAAPKLPVLPDFAPEDVVAMSDVARRAFLLQLLAYSRQVDAYSRQVDAAVMLVATLLQSDAPVGVESREDTGGPTWLIIKQVGQRLGKSPPTVRRILKRGGFPGARKMGGEWRIPKRAVEVYEAACPEPDVDDR